MKGILTMKTTRKLISAILAAVLCLSLAFTLISCGETPDNGGGTNDDGKPTYTVTVTDTSGAPIEGVKLMISDGASIFENKTTDKDGKASLALDAENTALGVMITTCDGYEKPTPSSGVFHAVFGNSKEITVKLSEKVTEMIEYTVKVVDQNGDAVEGVKLQICHSACVTCEELTGTDGITKQKLEAAKCNVTLKVGVLSVPEGYSIPDATIDGQYHAKIEVGETEVTVTVTKN